MGAHTSADLRQMQSLPLEAKIMMTKRRIREWYEHWDGQVYVSFSGGKDSTVLKHIADYTPGVYDVPAVFVNTGLEYPEIQQFVRAVKAGEYDCFNTDVEILRPEMRFDEVIKKYGYPVGTKRIASNIEYGRKAKKRGDTQKFQEYVHGMRTSKRDGDVYKFMPVPKKLMPLVDSDIKVSNKCCNVMKKKPLHGYSAATGRKAIVATMACESRQRADGWLKNGCNAFDASDPKSQPLSFWTEQDVLLYIKENNIPIASVYGEVTYANEPEQMRWNEYVPGFAGIGSTAQEALTTTGCKRTGCMFCMFGCHLEKEPNRFQRLKETHPPQYAYCICGGEYGPDGLWRPNSDGLGLGHVLDAIGVKY